MTGFEDWLVEQARKRRVLKATRFVGRLDHADDALGEPVLERKDVRQRTVISVGPERHAGGGVEQLRRHAKLVAGSANAVGDDRPQQPGARRVLGDVPIHHAGPDLVGVPAAR